MEHWSNFFPLILIGFKVIVISVCGYFAIKWHFDKDKVLKEKAQKQGYSDQQESDR